MPRLRKLTPAEIAALEPATPGPRAAAARAYDEYLAGFAAGDTARVELHDGERRTTVRRQLQAAAGRRGLVLRFRSSPGPLTFRVEALPAPMETAPTEEPIVAPRSDARPPRRRASAAERYREVLPRWMREEQPPGRRGDSKRRQGR